MRTRALLATLGLAVAALASPARADTGRLNLHVDLGLGVPLTGVLPAGDSRSPAMGGIMAVGVDYQVLPPLALELQVSAGAFGDGVEAGARNAAYGSVAAGLRVRPYDDDSGYDGEEGGSAAGDLWLSAHFGYHHLDGHQAGLDVGAGYEWSVGRPASLGVFARTGLLFGGDDDALDAFLVAGLNGSFELVPLEEPTPAPVDEDGDGLFPTDEARHGTDPTRADTDGDGLDDGDEVARGTDPTRADTDDDGLGDGDEVARGTDPLVADGDEDGLPDGAEIEHGTDPTIADGDEDGLLDGVEIRGGTDPHEADTDGDGLDDGDEDANRNGVRDEGETSPTAADTDEGGVADGVEREHEMDPTDAADDDPDGDGVLAPGDRCPDSARGDEVDASGCTIIRESLVLPGIEFETNSADLTEDSLPNLRRALRILQHDTGVVVEVAGHTDDVGARGLNRRLSTRRARAVREWLIAQGIAEDRLTARGYGHTRPIADNDTEEGRARNRRIELRRVER